MLMKKNRKRVTLIVAILLFSLLFQRFPVMAEQNEDYAENLSSVETEKTNEDLELSNSDDVDKDTELDTSENRQNDDSQGKQGIDIKEQRNQSSDIQKKNKIDSEDTERVVTRGEGLLKTQVKLTEFDLLTENLNKPPEYQIYEKSH